MESVVSSNMSKTGFDFRALTTEIPFFLENNISVDNIRFVMIKLFQMPLFSGTRKADINLKHLTKEL